MKKYISILIIKYLKRSMKLMKERSMVLVHFMRMLIRQLVKKNTLNLV